MRYRHYEPKVNLLLDLARIARRAEAEFPGEVSATEIMESLSGAASGWPLTLIDIILDHEERQAALWAKWKRWRSKQESIKRIARPNVAWMVWGKPPASVRKARRKK